jgi:hypothetical protein
VRVGDAADVSGVYAASVFRIDSDDGELTSSRVVGLKLGPLSLVRIIEELFQGNRGPGLEKRN